MTRGRRRRRPAVRILLHILAAVFGSLVILSGVAAWRLSSGPVSIGFLAPYAQESFAERHPGYELEIDDVILTWAGWEDALDILVYDTRIFDPAGAVLGTIPEASVVLSSRALLAGDIAFSRVDLIDPVINLVRMKSGKIALGMDGQTGGAGFALDSLIDPGRKGDAAGPRDRGSLTQMSLRNAELILDDQIMEKTWRATAVNADFLSVDAGLTGNFELDIDFVDDAKTHLENTFQYSPVTETVTLDLSFTGLWPRGLTDLSPDLEDMRAIEAPLSGRIKTTVTTSLEFGDLDYDLTGGSGRLILPDADAPDIVIKSLRATGQTSEGISVLTGDGALDLVIDGAPTQFAADYRYDRVADSIDLSLEISDLWPRSLAALLPDLTEIAGVEMPVSGTIETTLTTDLEIGDLVFDLTGRAGRLVVPGLYEPGLEMELLHAAGRARENFSVVSIDDLFMNFDGSANLTLDGVLNQSGEDFAFKGTVNLIDIPLDDFGIYWPEAIGQNPRYWIRRNLSDGLMSRLTVDVDISSDDLEGEFIPEDAVVGNLDLVGVTVNYLDPLPKVYGADGHVDFDGDSLRVTLENGRILDVLEIADGNIEITGVGVGEILDGLVTLRGPIQTQLELLNHPTLDFLAEFNIDPAGASGYAETRANLIFPFLYSMPIEEIEFTGQTSAIDFGLRDVIEGYDIADAAFQLTLDNTAMTLAGSASLNGVPIDVTWHEPLDDTGLYDGRIEIVGTVNDAQRKSLDIDTSPYLTGTTPLALTYTTYETGDMRLDLQLDATRARLDVPELFWSKPPYRYAELELSMDIRPGEPFEVSRIELDAPSFTLRGRASLEPESGTLIEADITSLKMGLSDTSGRVALIEDGGFGIAIEASLLDLAPILDNLFEPGDETERASFNLSLNADRVIMGTDPVVTADGASVELRMLESARAAVRYESDSWREVSLDALLPGGELVTVDLKPETGDARRLIVQTSDAGSLARVIGLYDNMVGGILDINATLRDAEPEHPMRGLATVKDFRIVRAPGLAQMLSYVSLFGLLDVLQGEGISFAKLEFPFTLQDDLLTTDKAIASGTSLGINFSGQIHMVSHQVHAEGTFAPAYVINSLLSDIPIIGDILGGESGLLAAKFTIDGRMDDPDVSVNPISILTPGFLRGLFG